MGSPYHHYIIADENIIPESHEKYYSEKVVRLKCYQPNDRKRTVSTQCPSRKEVGLPEDAIVYCSLNGFQKLNRATFLLWLKILSRVPNSVLWLLSDLKESQATLLEIADTNGVSSSRLVFAGSLPNPDHLARYQLADIFLDNMPYGAHTTAADSLWMGTPIVTLPGQSFASRVCSSLLNAVGLEDLVAKDEEDYIDRAVTLGKDKNQLRALKRHLLSKRNEALLFDSPTLVSDLEKLYTIMWNDYQSGCLPRPDLHNLDIYREISVNIDHEAIGLINRANNDTIYLSSLKRRDIFAKIQKDVRLWN